MRLEVALEDFKQGRHEDHKQDRHDIRDSLMTLHGVSEEELDFVERAMLLYGRPENVDAALNDENETIHDRRRLVTGARDSLRRTSSLVTGSNREDQVPFPMSQDALLAWFKGALAVASEPWRKATITSSASSESDPPPRGD